MNTQQATTLIGIAAGSTLLIAAMLMGTFVPRSTQPSPTPLAPAASKPADTPLAMTQEESAPARSNRRPAHASLSMPYFSFAQLLRTGG